MYCYIIEEHNEAFYIWVNAFKKSLIKKNCCLLHFDDHSDFRTPVFADSINDILTWNDTSIFNFTYNQVNIDTFISPCIYLKIIKDFVWIRHDMPIRQKKEMRMRSYNGLGKKILQEEVATIDFQNNDSQQFSYTKTNAEGFFDTTFNTENEIILDIDLDYFSCCENPFIENEIIIEISEEEYKDFIDNRKYHYLNYITANVSVKQQNGSFFYVLNYIPESYPSKRKVSEETIIKRINQMIFNLEKKDINPVLITLCRSRNSGFTPSDQWEFIEKQLLEKLSVLYPLTVMHIGNPIKL